MTRAEMEQALADAIDAESQVGPSWWPGVEMASVAYRRWQSFDRRHGARQATLEDRLLDLAKGLQAQFEPEKLYTPMSEWLYLARLLAGVLAKG